jgi:hypothetical protein
VSKLVSVTWNREKPAEIESVAISEEPAPEPEAAPLAPEEREPAVQS